MIPDFTSSDIASIRVIKNAVPPATAQTPSSMDTAHLHASDETWQAAMLIGSRLGYPIGYIQEQNGKLVQDIFPIKQNETEQISTSSLVNLALHTETAFHPYLPAWVILFCLRGDPLASTSHAFIDDILSHIDKESISVLMADEFVTSIDPSFMTNGESDRAFPIRPLTQTKDGIVMCYDSALTIATTERAQVALDKFKAAVDASLKYTVLEDGDALVINNRTMIHGRVPFTPRYDGTDRWLRRVMVRDSYVAPEHIQGNLITLQF